MNATLKNKVAIVTGGGRGLGKAIAIALAKNGARLVLMSRTMRELRETAKETELPRRKLVMFAGSISRESDVDKMVRLALAKFGTIDILVNNAGTVGPVGPTSKVDVQDWVMNIQVNLVGTFLCTRKVLPVLIAKGHGKIVNIAGSGEGPLANFSAYASSKSAIVRFTETLAEEVRDDGIDVNAVAPGGISTKMTREIFSKTKALGNRISDKYKKVLDSGGVPLEIPASLVSFLASSESDGLTGKTISAVHDNWKSFASMKADLNKSSLYTFRRIEPHLLERLRLPGRRAKFR